MKAIPTIQTLTLCFFILAGAGCSGKQELGTTTNAAAGISWSVPARWTVSGERPMRVATYAVPPGAECAVFYFGGGQGGAVRPNIDRWIGQFENPSEPRESERTVAGMKVITVTTTGTYLAPAGPMMQSQGKLEDHMLLGAIVEAPEGSVFFKLTGPAAAVEGAKTEFDAMLDSITKK